MHFNSTNGQVTDSHKHLGLVVDSNLNFNEHVDSKITKCNKIIGLMKKRSQFLSRKSLLTIYKSFVRPNLNIQFTVKSRISQKIESLRNDACVKYR